MSNKNNHDDDVPKAVKRMKKENTEQNQYDEFEKVANKKAKIKKRKKIKFILSVIIIFILISAIYLSVSANSWKKLAREMMNVENSKVIDSDGELIAELGSEKKQIKVTSAEIPNNLKNAYVAIEDERFYEHGGVDIKRTASAIASYIIHFGSSSYGGSTITQQLVKNVTGDSTDSINRKVREWWKACILESILSKDEILTGYLNIIYVGPNIYGVEAGSQYYFSKSISDLSIAESAFLAGINNAPNSYNPFGDTNTTDKITKRTKIVISKMHELEYINEDEKNQAISEIDNGLKFKKGEIISSSGVYSYHTDALINEITEEIQKKYNISETFATNYINNAGLTIKSTQNSNIQKEAEIEFEKDKYIRESKIGGEHSQAAMIIIDHTTGEVRGCIGGLGKKTDPRCLNRATQSIRQTGSAIKPLSILAPAIDKKIITASSIYDDTERDFADGYHPTDYSNQLGKITVRKAVESSQNIPFVEIMEELEPKTAIKYMEKMGISTLTREDDSLVLALGGLQRGISPLEMAGAYSAIANDGKYIEPTFYKSIINKAGKEILKSKQKTRRVISKEAAYIIKNILTEPVQGSNGTATYCKISGVDVAAKTGTTDENYDRWLCGFTPYYTSVSWYGYDQNESVEFNKKNPAGLLWANVMSRIHTGLKSVKFIKPNSIVSVTICAETGKKARKECSHPYTECFLSNTVPGICNTHTGEEIDKNNYKKNNSAIDLTQDAVQEITNEIDVMDPQEKQKDDIKNITNVIDEQNSAQPSSGTGIED